MSHVVANMIEIIQRYLTEHQQQNHHHLLDENIIQSFLHTASSFRDFLIHSKIFFMSDFDAAATGEDQVDKLMLKMVDAAHKAEDAIELQIMRNFNQQPQLISDADDVICELDMVAEEFECIKQVLLNRGEHQPTLLWGDQSPLLVPSASKSSSSSDMKKKKKKRRKVDDFVGIYEDDFQALKLRLVQPTPQLHIIPILGLTWGMGKRTLALRLYNDSYVADHFHVHACIGALFENDVKVILLNLLESLGNIITKDIRRQTVDEIGLILTNFLRYRKYCLVLHNVMDGDVWGRLRRFFPDDGCGSRIIFTARSSGESSNYGGEPHMMRFLRDSESWLLFCQMVFQQDHCPLHELEPIAKVLVDYCKGVAQTICLIAGLLATSEMEPSFWELVAETHYSQLQGDECHEIIMSMTFMNIYVHLPYYLKPCLLYISAFHECSDIKASNIIQLWIAEGFVEKGVASCLEGTAEAYLDILIDKNLLHLCRQDPNGRVKAFQIQPVLRIIYMLMAKREKFMWSKDFCSIMENNYDKDIRRISGSQLLQPSDEIELPPYVRSFLSTGHASPPPTHVFVGMEFLRILAVFQLELFQFPAEILHMFLLRYLSFSCHSNTPVSISKLWNLQMLNIRRLPWFRAFSLPIELLGMAQLTHVKCKETFVWRCPANGKKFLHSKLETLSNMQLLGLSNEFFEQIPNIRKLGIFCNIAMQFVLDLSCLYKLERLKCSTDWSLASKNFLSNIKFPSLLRKVTFTLCRIPPGFMKVVGALSSLEELKLHKSDFLVMESGPAEPEWEPAEGGFPRLISLVMKDLNLVNWKAHANHFPRLQQLIILNCYAMLGLPEDIGDIQTLELIHVNRHSPSVVASVMKIMENHYGNPILQVQITKK